MYSHNHNNNVKKMREWVKEKYIPLPSHYYYYCSPVIGMSCCKNTIKDQEYRISSVSLTAFSSYVFTFKEATPGIMNYMQMQRKTITYPIIVGMHSTY